MANRFLSNIQINDAYTFPASDGSLGQAIITDGAGNLSFGNVASGNTTLYQDNFTGNGATTDFTLANSVNNEIKTLVFLNGVYQFKDTYSVSGTTLSFDTAPANGTLIEVITIGSAASQADIDKLAGIEAGAQVNTLDGSGTANYVSKWSDADTITNSSIQDDGSTVSVGGNLTVTGSLTGTLATAAQTNITSVGTLSSLAVSGNATVGSVLAVNSDALYVTTGKNVGLGTSSPTKALQITKNNAEVVINVASSDTGVSGIYFGDQSDPIRAGLILDNNTDTLELRSSDNNSSVYLTSNERVGIGAAAPSEKLEVAGNVILDSSNANIKLKSGVTGTKGDIQWTFNTDSTVYASVGLEYDNRSTDGFLIDSGYPITLDAATGYIRFSNNGSEKMRIDASGNVGIGESTPLVPLHISKNTASGENIALILDNNDSTANNEVALLFRSYVGSTNTDFQIATINTAANQAQLVFRSDGGAERMRITSAGNVGIGSSTPAGKFEVNVGSSAAYFTRTAGNAGTSSPAFGILTDSVGSRLYSWGDAMKFHTIAVGGSPSERMRINSSGRVGIGTSSPNALLEVSSATGISPITPSVIRISTTNNAAGWDLGSPWGALQFYSADTSDGGAKVHAQISANCKSSTGGISDIVFSQAAPATGVLTERMKIDATAGNVGIGTSSVVSKLTVLSENAPTLDNTTHAGEALFLRSGGSAGQNNIQSVLAFGKADGGSLRSGSAIGSVQTGADEDQIGLAFYTSPSSTSAQTLSEKLRINHDGGITFNGDTAAANALDDYEEGLGHQVLLRIAVVQLTQLNRVLMLKLGDK
jgi:hypothetical protein